MASLRILPFLRIKAVLLPRHTFRIIPRASYLVHQTFNATRKLVR